MLVELKNGELVLLGYWRVVLSGIAKEIKKEIEEHGYQNGVASERDIGLNDNRVDDFSVAQVLCYVSVSGVRLQGAVFLESLLILRLETTGYKGFRQES